MQNFGNDQLATRTCWQCKSSKKKCDKLLPTCSRCSRLSIECAYDGEKPDAAPSNHDSNDTKFEQIFQRLERLEHLISNPDSPTTTRTSASHEPPPSYVSNIDHSCQPPSWQVDPGQLKQEYVGFMLWGSVFRIMSESHTTIDAVADNYFKWTHQWLPMISRSRFDTGLERLKVYSTDRGSSLTILAMHLTVTPVSEHPGSTPLSDSPWYRACKYYFSYFASVEEPTVDIIQAGILLALFEHMQSIDNKALTTLGICGRLACALDLDDIVAQALIREPGEISSEVEEAIQTWFALILLDRYFNMPPVQIPQQPIIHQKPFQVSFLERSIMMSPVFHKPGRDDLPLFLLEMEASRLVAQVQTVMRDNRRTDIGFLFDVAPPIPQEVDKLVECMKTKQQPLGSFAGILVSLGAALQLHIWYVRKIGRVDEENVLAIVSYVEQIHDIVVHCIIDNGFTEHYLEGIQPSWISVVFQAVMAYKLVKSTRPQNISIGMDTSPFMTLLSTAATRYKFAERCIEIIYNTYCRSEAQQPPLQDA